jgi:hypothetical protein
MRRVGNKESAECMEQVYSGNLNTIKDQLRDAHANANLMLKQIAKNRKQGCGKDSCGSG